MLRRTKDRRKCGPSELSLELVLGFAPLGSRFATKCEALGARARRWDRASCAPSNRFAEPSNIRQDTTAQGRPR
jgi:hypothetical protein